MRDMLRGPAVTEGTSQWGSVVTGDTLSGTGERGGHPAGDDR